MTVWVLFDETGFILSTNSERVPEELMGGRGQIAGPDGFAPEGKRVNPETLVIEEVPGEE